MDDSILGEAFSSEPMPIVIRRLNGVHSADRSVNVMTGNTRV